MSSYFSFYLCFVIALGVFQAKAQDMIMLEGRVLNDSIEHEYLHVLNLSLQKGVTTNQEGQFTIPARLGDTLYISALQFVNQEFYVTPKIFGAGFVEVKLETEVNQLEDVQISDIQLNGRLGEDMNRIPVEKPFNPAEAGLPVYTGSVLTQEERRLFTATHSAGGIIPVDALINAITGKTKRLKEYVRISNMEIKVQKARNLVTDSTYINQLLIPPRLIDDFVHYVYFENPETLVLAATNNPLSLIEMLQEKAPQYLRFREGEGVNQEGENQKEH